MNLLESNNVNVTYGGLSERVAAGFIDTVILVIASTFLNVLLNDYNPLLNVAVSWLYSALMESSQLQATLGKLALKLKVTDVAYQRISFGQATKRVFCQYITTLTLGIGYIILISHSKKQTLHDRIARTLVIKRPSAVAQ